MVKFAVCAHAERTITKLEWKQIALRFVSFRFSLFVYFFESSRLVTASGFPCMHFEWKHTIKCSIWCFFFSFVFIQCSLSIVCSVAKTVVWETVRTAFVGFSLFDVKFDWIDLCRCRSTHTRTRTRSEESMEEKCFPVAAEGLDYVNGHRHRSMSMKPDLCFSCI